MLVVYVNVVYAWRWSWLQLCHHVKVDEVDVGCVYHEYMSFMNWLCVSVFLCNGHECVSYIC